METDTETDIQRRAGQCLYTHKRVKLEKLYAITYENPTILVWCM